ncbi:glycosyltransferase family 2 protein [Rhodobacterales bacterium HKCCE3408]|nr:glycosyltransferase family 2 protein [Rhodobacterales bacterium HKCCE3408]
MDAGALARAYRLRWRRRDYLWRAFRARHALTPLADRTGALRPDTIRLVATVRNETGRLPFFLDHHRRLGVGQFLFVVNDSDDGTAAYLADQPDCSVWETGAGYKAARFGMDWAGWLLAMHGSGAWCLTLDADELLVYPHWEDRPLPDLIRTLESEGRESFGTLTVDLYPKGRLSEGTVAPGDDPTAHLAWFDPGPYRQRPQPDLRVDLFQGGVRDRLFFGSAPDRAPTMNKVPLVKWHWRYAYRNSTHSILPPRLNDVFDLRPGGRLSGALLHTKFLPSVITRAAEEKARGQHFARAEVHAAYYDALVADPILWSETVSRRYSGWRDLAGCGLMGTGSWG